VGILIRVNSFLLILFLFGSCASYKTQYAGDARNWAADSIIFYPNLLHTMYLVGDAGYTRDSSSPVLRHLHEKLKRENKNSSIIFLGDNIYEKGMPPESETAKREEAEFRILSQLKILDEFPGRPVFIPGNHDWGGWGLKGLKRQENFVENYLNKKRGVDNKDQWVSYFIPDEGCSGAEVIELTDDIVLIVIDSEWWLSNWDKEPGINADCEVKNRAVFKFAFENVLRKYRNKQVVVAMHHPLYTYGSHGGRFTMKQHLFPLTDRNPELYVPLPIVGSLAVLYRSTIGMRQDMVNQQYRELRKGILAAANKNGQFIFASGHEHALQFIERSGQSFIISGSGSKQTPLRLGKGSQFASGQLGYSTIKFYDNGESIIQFWEVSENGGKASLVYQKKRTVKTVDHSDLMELAGTSEELKMDSVHKKLIEDPVDTVGGLHKSVLGEHYRKLYQQTYTFPVLNFRTWKGGVEAVKIGGGNQTNSLRLRDKEGKEYAMRGLDKDVTRFLPYPFNRMTAARFVVQDNFLSTHPFAPIAVSSLAEAVNVYHTNPSIYYVPAQTGLSTYVSIFGDANSLVEERPAGKKWKKANHFGYPDKIIGTPELLEKLKENNKYKIDGAFALRSRLLDIIVGDWDRHDDQWAWGEYGTKDSGYFRPIPRDRDQAFSKYDGTVVSIAHFTMPFLRQLQVYGPEIRSIKWNSWSARLFDRSFLTEMSWPQWEEQVKFIQQELTDEKIENAFKIWPDKARELTAAHIIRSIKSRRDHLFTIARAHYKFISSTVNVVGTDEPERFLIERIDDQHTGVSVYEISKSGAIKKLNYQRVFENKITTTLNIYGNGSADQFIINGNVKKGVKVRVIGGSGKDIFTDSSSVRRGFRKTLVYDDMSVNTINGGRETKDLRTPIYRFNYYDRRDYSSEYNILIPTPLIGFNPDDGVLAGANFNMIRYGFKKEPFKSNQHFGGYFGFGTMGYKLNYTGDFIAALGRSDLYIDALFKNKTYAFNFAGIGNDTERPVDDADYYRVRQSELLVYAAYKKRLGINGFFAAGPFLQVSDIENTPGRFISDSSSIFKENIFTTTNFTGLRTILEFNNVDNAMSPHSGIRFNTSLNYFKGINNNVNFTSWRIQLTFFTALDKNENIILASQLGSGINFGSGALFFQMPSIGGNRGLRGFRTERFYGNSSFWHSTDLRFRFGSSVNKTLPFTFGMFTSFDYGRVWEKEVSSSTWHFNYGGGLWFAPVDIITISLGTYVAGGKNEEKPRIVLKVGFGF
jgi:hypothetical protein